MVFNKYDLVIFDADGTLRECTLEGQEYPVAHSQWVIRPNVVSEISKYDWRNKYFGIATNQPGISLGVLSESMCTSLIEEMVKQAFGFLPPTSAMQYCPHHIDGQCDCRKPQPGMLKNIMKLFHIDESKTIFVGDSEKDKVAANNAGCDFMLGA